MKHGTADAQQVGVVGFGLKAIVLYRYTALYRDPLSRADVSHLCVTSHIDEHTTTLHRSHLDMHWGQSLRYRVVIGNILIILLRSIPVRR